MADSPAAEALWQRRQEAVNALYAAAANCPSVGDTEAFDAYQTGTMEPLREALRTASDEYRVAATRSWTEHTFTSEAEAHFTRRAYIHAGSYVSLVAYDPGRGVYAFDLYH